MLGTDIGKPPKKVRTDAPHVVKLQAIPRRRAWYAELAQVGHAPAGRKETHVFFSAFPRRP